MKLIESAHTRLLSKAMDVYTLRHRITSANIANIDTPGYNKLSVSFEEELRKSSEGQLPNQELSQTNPKIVEHDDSPVLEEEMLTMADTQIRVQLVARALRGNFESLRSGITGRTQ